MQRLHARYIITLVLFCTYPSQIFAKTPELATEDAGKGGTYASASQLAVIVISDTRVDTASINLVNAILAEMFNKNKDLALLDSAFPGMQAAIRESLQGPLKKEVSRVNVEYRKDLAALYAGNLAEDDIRRTIEFYQSPAGAALFDSLQQSMNLSNVASEFAAEKDASAEALSKDQSVAGVRAVYSLSPAHRDDVIAFFSSPSGKNLTALNEKKIAIDVKWSNYLSPEAEAEVGQAVQKAMVAHVAKTDPKAAEDMRIAMEEDAKASK